MFEDRVYIAPHYTLECCKEVFFNLRITSATAEWDQAIEIFKDRMDARFFDAIRILLQQCKGHQWEHNLSFSIMALDCLLIETLQQFYEGIESTPPRQNHHTFRKFFRQSDQLNFSKEITAQFYRNVRCGILHQAETKGNVALSFAEFGELFEIKNNGWLVFNVKLITEALFREFENYVYRLGQTSETNLRQNFIRKMNFIILQAHAEEALASDHQPHMQPLRIDS